MLFAERKNLMITLRNAVFVTLGICCGALGADRSVRQVEIDSRWGGLGTPQSFHRIIRSERGAFYSGEQRVEAAKVQALVDALGAAPLPRPTLDNLDITPKWLRTNARRLLSERDHSFVEEAQNIQQLQISAFSNPTTVERLLPSIFDTFHTDDYPSVRVVATFDDGASVSAQSGGQGPYLLPWTVKPEAKTYDAHIARAIAALMPEKVVNRDRLRGDNLPDVISNAVRDSVEERRKKMDAANRAGDAIAALRQHFSVLRTEVNPYHGPAHGTKWQAGREGETNLHISLHRATLPRNLVTEGIFLHQNGKTSGVDGFLARGAKYESIVTSTPWLMNFIRSHPDVRIEILYVHDKSFGDHALETFAKDMQTRGKPELIERVRSQQNDITLLVALGKLTGSYWLLFPDHSMLLWRYEGLFDLLKWKPTNFGEPRCGDYQVNNGGCPAAQITPDGTLVSESTYADEACVAAFHATHPAIVLDDEPLFPVHLHDRGGFIDRRGNVALPLCFDTVGEFSEGLARFERDGRWGFIDRAGHIVIKPVFMWARGFSDGLARVQLSGPVLSVAASWGFIDKSGQVVIRLTEDQSGYGTEEEGFHEGLALIGDVGKKGFIDKTGRVVIAPRFGYGYGFQNGITAVSEDNEGNRWGFIDKTGQWVIPPHFDWADPFEEGLAAVNRKRDCGFIDRTGAFVLKPPVPQGETDCAAVWGSFHNGLARWRFGKKFGYIDRTGKTVIEARYDLTPGFSEGLAAVQLNGKWGYIDTTGKMVIEPRELHTADPFRNGLAHVATKDGKHGYIDKTGKCVWGPQKQNDE